MQSGTPLVLDLSGLGDEPAALIGAVVINTIKQAAEKVCVPYDLYIDEFQNFGTSTLATMLAESGKFGLNLVLAHQFLSQLSDEVRDAVLGNCSTVISFRVGPEDAPTIARALGCEPGGLLELGRGRALFRTLVDGRVTSALALETEKAELPTGRLERNIRTTRANFARARANANSLSLFKVPSRNEALVTSRRRFAIFFYLRYWGPSMGRKKQSANKRSRRRRLSLCRAIVFACVTASVAAVPGKITEVLVIAGGTALQNAWYGPKKQDSLRPQLVVRKEVFDGYFGDGEVSDGYFGSGYVALVQKSAFRTRRENDADI